MTRTPPLALLQDQAFVGRLAKGDVEARAALFASEVGAVERVITRMIGPRLEVHDLAHDAFVEIFRSAHRFQGDRSALSGWVRGIAVHVVQRYLRQRGDRQAVALWADPSEEDLVEATDASPSLRASVHRLYQLTATLPADEREALHLRYFAELELTEVAASVGVSLATIKRRLVLARTSLAAAAAHDVILMHWIQEFDHGE